MFDKIKETVKSQEFRSAVANAAMNVVATVVVATAIKAVSYVAVEGTKALIEKIKENKEETPAE